MNKIFKYTSRFFISCLIVVAISCATDNKPKGTDNAVQHEQKQINKSNVTYKLPSPVELYIFLKEHKIPYDNSNLNKIENVSKYYTNYSKYVNFGIYASDLAYSTVYEDQQQSFLYFSTVKTLADELGFAEGFDEIAAKRIEQNSFNSDSLYQIATDAYWEACIYLEDLGQTSELALIVAGGWIESAYLAEKSIKEFKENDPSIIRIAEQQILLENLIEYLENENNQNVQKVLGLLKELQEKFDILYDNEDNVIITKEQFNIIAKEIDRVRNELIK
ncbi:MAG: hypothetical protein GXO79_07555 [Chlorobi bacterium]|nr:hypothetical protein [Chlorobiota bacterium]